MNMMIPEPEAYFSRRLPRRSSLLQRLEAQAETEDIPIVGPMVGELLYLLARISRARRILELGTATGYSALFLAEACRETGGRVTTLETDSSLASRAAENLAEAGLADFAEVIRDDALEWLARTDAHFDLIFMDIEKEDYLPALGLCARVLTPEGLLVADNVAFQDADPFNRTIAADPAWRPVNLYAFLPGHSPSHDGLCLAVKTA